MNKKIIVSLTALAAITVGCLGIRQAIGSSMNNQCQLASEEFSTVAQLQLNDMKSADFYIDQIKENPFSAIMVGSDVMKLANDVSNRWDEYNTKMEAKDEVCYPVGTLSKVFSMDRFVRETRMSVLDLEIKIDDLADSIQERTSNL